MAREVVHSTHLDANESAFFARELEHIKSHSYDVMYPEFKAQRLIPVSTEAGPGAESITYQQFDRVGMMKIISNYADDLPRSDIKGKEFTSPIRSIGASYGYNVQEIRAAQMVGRPLQQRRANAVRQAYEQTVNRIAWFARPTDAVWGGLTGFLYNPNIPSAGATTGNWAAATADQILADMNKAVNDVISLTKGVEIPDTILLPYDEYTLIASMARSTTSDTTVLEYFKRNHPEITMVEPVNELADVNPRPSGAGGAANLMVVYKRSPDKLTLEIPQPFEQFPAQERGLEYVVHTHARCGGVIVYYPLSINIVEAI